MANNPLVSVVIPHWNAKNLLETCLNALRAQTYDPIEVIIADNASEDGSRAYIREHFPEVHLIELPENRGFTGACNAGMQAANGEIIALLNNDTEVDAGWAAAIVDAFARHPQVGVVASKMLLFDQRDTFHTAGDGFTTDGRPFNRGVWQKDIGQYDREEFVFSACGGSSAYRKALLDEIGLLDDDFFFLMEDVDLAWRAQLAGWRVLYVPQAVVYHMLSATGGGVTASYYDGRNSIYLLLKDIPGWFWRAHWRSILARQVRLATDAVRHWRGEAARARLRGMLAGVVAIPRLLRKRKTIQEHKRANQEQIESLLTTPAELATATANHTTTQAN